MNPNTSTFLSPEDRLVIALNDESSPVRIGAAKLLKAMADQGIDGRLAQGGEGPGLAAVQVTVVSPSEALELKPEGFSLNWSDSILHLKARDPVGAMYGLFELAEQIEITGSVSAVMAKKVNPRFAFRAVKYNLPWHSYRENQALQANQELTRDLGMWEALLDLMVESRLNALTLWNVHPFSYMIRTRNFPLACPFSDEELADWKKLWSTVFKMAKDRGIKTYVLNWNICVSEAFVEHYGEGTSKFWADGYTSPQIEQYTRESMTQLINEYPDLTGFGVTPGEAMQKWDGSQMAGWFDRTIFQGIREANRPIRLIYRAALHGDPHPHRELIKNCGISTPDKPIIVELKFNWSHPHSTTTLVHAHGGGTGEGYWTNPAPTHHKMAWMIRNEDFFRLRWGDPDFIREHMTVNGQDYVDGYFIGSECYIPAKDIFTRPERVHWKYDFERKWLYYKQWGRLLYDSTVSDAVFAHDFDQRYPGKFGKRMVEAFKLSSRTSQRILQFFEHTWDHTIYAEGLIGNNRDFITLQEFIDHTPFDPKYVSIKRFGGGVGDFKGRVTPPQVATEIEGNCRRALTLIQGIETTDLVLESEIDDVAAWAHLGLYFSEKIRAALSLNQESVADAHRHMEAARQHWGDLVKVTEDHYQPSYASIIEGNFHWKAYQERVNAEAEWVKIH